MNSLKRFFARHSRFRRGYLLVMMGLFAGAYVLRTVFAQAPAGEGEPARHFVPFALFSEAKYSRMEVVALLSVLAVAIAGLLYALLLVKQVKRADQGTRRMQEIAAAVREGANAYLSAQFGRIGPLIIILTILLFATYTGSENAFRWGRAMAFLVGALFSWTVGFVGMRLA